MEHHAITFIFIENGHTCKTSYSSSGTIEEVEAEAREWFGFEKDGIEVVKVIVNF